MDPYQSLRSPGRTLPRTPADAEAEVKSDTTPLWSVDQECTDFVLGGRRRDRLAAADASVRARAKALLREFGADLGALEARMRAEMGRPETAVFWARVAGELESGAVR